MTYTQLRVTAENNVVSATVWVPSWSICGLVEGQQLRLQRVTAPQSHRVWTLVGFGTTRWGQTADVALPQPVAVEECPVWQR